MSAKRRAKPQPERSNHRSWFAADCPTNKRGYETKAEARKVARLLRKQGDPRLMSPYRCDDCKHFHIGHLPREIIRGEVTRGEYYDGEAA